MISASCAQWKFSLRDYPQPLLHIRDLELWGRLIGAEQRASKRGGTTCVHCITTLFLSLKSVWFLPDFFITYTDRTALIVLPPSLLTAIRNVRVEVGAPWQDITVHRTMSALKFYHDFSCEVKTFVAAYGPCWEPAVAQFNIGVFGNCMVLNCLGY